MGRDCLVEAGKGFRNASERPGEGLCDFEKNAVKRMYGRCELRMEWTKQARFHSLLPRIMLRCEEEQL